jgi:hypothetical protein
VLIAVERLLTKLRQPRSRADELIALRARLRAERDTPIDDEERAIAASVLAQKRTVAAQLDAVQSCGGCATKHPLPIGRFAGGACCAGVTADLFDAHELAALAHAGTRPHDLVAPRTDHAGCAFRGATGCTLALAHRPARCVHYVCTTLRRELHARDQLDATERDLAELDRRMQHYRAVHQARLDREVLAPLLDALASATRT